MAWRENLRVARLTVVSSPSGREIVWIVNEGAPTDGTTGTGAGIADTGSLCSDCVNGKLYINTNTKASPLWTVAGAQTT